VTRLLVQPDDGAAPLLEALDSARRRLDLYVFRLDDRRVAEALERAVRRGVAVRALVAHTRRGGAAPLRKLEARLRAIGVDVSRSDDDLQRYHGKMAIVDDRRLLVLGYNFTRRDMEHSRSFGLMLEDKRVIAQARQMYEADFARRPYVPEHGTLVVSPFNSRAVLARLIQQARRQILIYDKRLSDELMLRLIERQARAGVEVRVIGAMQRRLNGVAAAPFPGRLHVRAIIQDGRRLFVGSQSLRREELDERREIGAVVSTHREVARALRVFQQDWVASQSTRRSLRARLLEPPRKPAPRGPPLALAPPPRSPLARRPKRRR
jgi:phosphatidylserine/phosphatidylglycerophosphate/cardiolipin synthase-like enzyme